MKFELYISMYVCVCMGQVSPLLSFDVQRKSGAFSYKVEVGMCVYSDEVQRLNRDSVKTQV